MSEYIKKDDILSAAVEVEYLGRPRMMVSVAKIRQLSSIEINDAEAEHTCENCYYRYFDSKAYPCSMCVCGEERKDMWKRKKVERFATDDITWCMAECVTDCPRQPRYIRDKTIPHSYSDFSKNCMAYEPKGESDDRNQT